MNEPSETIESPIRIAVEFEGIEPNERVRVALDELRAAATQQLEDTAEVTGFYLGGSLGDEFTSSQGVWTDMRPDVKSWSFGVEREFTFTPAKPGR